MPARIARAPSRERPVSKRAFFLRSLIMLLLAALAGLTAVRAHAGTANFAQQTPVLDLGAVLEPYHAAGQNEADDSRWFMMTAVNPSVRTATRILLAEQPVDSAVRVFPLRSRASIRQVAASDSAVIVENAHAYGRYAFRVTIPAASSVALAIRLVSADAHHPAVSAWTEPALSARNRQLAVFYAVVVGLIASALAITTGLAAMTGHAAPRWAAATLLGLLLSRLAAWGLFDALGTEGVGGPDGVAAMLAGVTLAAGLQFAGTVAPFESRERLAHSALLFVLFVSVLAFIGFPGAMLATEISVVAGAALIAVHLVHKGLTGAQAARVAAPAAVVFALVSTAGAVSALGGFHASAAAPGVIGGFAATGAVLLALAVAAGEGIAILPARRPESPLPTFDAEPRTEPGGSEADKAIGASYQGMFDFDLDREIVSLSAETAALMGQEQKAETLQYTAWLDRLHPDDRGVFHEAMQEFSERKGLAFRVEFRALAGMQYAWYELRATMLGDGAQFGRCLGLIAEVTARKEAETRSNPEPTRDWLTQLPNRTALLEELERLAHDLGPVTLALLDIDRFKTIHASLGDAGGDSVLVDIAQRLRSLTAAGSLVFRTGGDSFAVLAPQMRMSAAALGDHILSLCGEPHSWNGRSVYAPASVGLAPGRDAASASELMKNAELALLHAKREGGACARIYNRELDVPPPPDPVVLEAALREALKEGELDLCYQPIVRLSDGSLAGFEALLRWNNPERGTLSPADFIDHAERTGLILELGRFALERAAEDLAHWQRTCPMETPLFASVNVSRRQLMERKFERLVTRLVTEGSLAPGSLKLEVTETAVSSGPEMLDVLQRLRRGGAGLAIDDFGTGLSTLSQLKDVPFDTVKIDKSFLARHGSTHEDPDGAVVLRSIVNLAHELDRVVVVEGVESETDARWLAEIGCDFAQGYYFSVPIRRAEVADFIAAHCPAGSETDSVSGVASVGGET